MRYYLYKTTCIPTGKYYYGVHSERRKSDGYIGCGVCSNGTAKRLKRKGVKSAFIDSVIKYGYHNFYKEILMFFDSAKEAYEREAEIVDIKKVKDKNCLNLKLGGFGGAVPSTMTETTLIDSFNNSVIHFESRSECQHALGVSNVSKSKVILRRYVKKEYSTPVNLISENGYKYFFLDILSCKNILGLNVDKVRMMIRGERKSTSSVVNGVKTKYYICTNGNKGKNKKK